MIRVPQCLTHSSTQNLSPSFSISSFFCIPTNCCYEALFLLKKKKSVCIICMKLPRIFQIVGTLGDQAHSCSRCCWCLMRSGGVPCGWSCPAPAADSTVAPTAIFSKGLPLSNFNCFGVRPSSQQPVANDF